MAVRGTVSVCAKCGHGGHFAHMQTWFARSNVCASGCGCRCNADGNGADKTADDSNSDEEGGEEVDVEEYAEDGENLRVHDIYNSFFGINPPDYLEEIYNQSSDYNYNNFFDKWGESRGGDGYYEYS